MWNLVVIAAATVAFFVMDYRGKRRPIITEQTYIQNTGLYVSSALKGMTISAIKWGFSGLALTLTTMTFLVITQPAYRVVLAALLCGAITANYAPSFRETGLPEAQQRLRNTSLIGSNVIATFLAGQAYLYLQLAPLFFLVFILIQMFFDLILSTISQCLIQMNPRNKRG